MLHHPDSAEELHQISPAMVSRELRRPVKPENGVANVPDPSGSDPSVNVWEFITRTVPKGTRRAVNRWKGPDPDGDIR